MNTHNTLLIIIVYMTIHTEYEEHDQLLVVFVADPMTTWWNPTSQACVREARLSVAPAIFSEPKPEPKMVRGKMAARQIQKGEWPWSPSATNETTGNDWEVMLILVVVISSNIYSNMSQYVVM